MLIKKENTLIIVDWDDTLLPSSTIFYEERNNDKALFNIDFDRKPYILSRTEINAALIDLLKYLKNLGTVIIITSSKDNWVLYSAKEYLSCEAVELLKELNIYYVEDVLKKYGIKNVSIDRKKEVVFEVVINEWIENNMQNLSNSINLLFNNNEKVINIVSLGDGYQELNAYNYITKRSPLMDKIDIIYKHIEYIEQPSYDDLITEYKLIKKGILDIVNDVKTKHYKFLVVKNY